MNWRVAIDTPSEILWESDEHKIKATMYDTGMWRLKYFNGDAWEEFSRNLYSRPLVIDRAILEIEERTGGFAERKDAEERSTENTDTPDTDADTERSESDQTV